MITMSSLRSPQSRGAAVARSAGIPAATFLALIVAAAVVRPSMFMDMMRMMASHM